MQQDVYWNFRNNYKTIFIQSARSVVQPYLVAPTLRLYNSIYSFWTNNVKRCTTCSDSSSQLPQTCSHTSLGLGLCCEGRLLLSSPPPPTPQLEPTELTRTTSPSLAWA